MRFESIPLYWCIFLLAAAGLSGLLARGRKRSVQRSRMQVYAASAINLIVAASITAAVAYLWARSSLRTILSVSPPPMLFAWAAGISVACIAVTWAVFFWRLQRGAGLSAAATHLLPRTGAERLAFLVLCLTTGVCEEYVYRGFSLALLCSILHSALFAVAIVSLAFAINHLAQDDIAAVRALVLGAILAAPVILTGSLWPSIIAHVLVNAVTGLTARRLIGLTALA